MKNIKEIVAVLKVYESNFRQAKPEDTIPEDMEHGLCFFVTKNLSDSGGSFLADIIEALGEAKNGFYITLTPITFVRKSLPYSIPYGAVPEELFLKRIEVIKKIETIDETLDKISTHDWFYGFSDDDKVYQEGREREKQIAESAKQLGAALDMFLDEKTRQKIQTICKVY